MKKRSVIFRVTLYYAAAMIFILLLVFGVLYVFSTQSVISTSQRVVERVVQDAYDHIEFNEASISVGASLDLFNDGVSLLIYDGDGQLLLGTRPGTFPSSTPLISGRHQTVSGIGEPSESWNIYDMMVSYRSTSVWVRGIYSGSTADSFVRQLIAGAAILIPLLAVVALIMGYLITRKAFLPIRYINQTVNEIQGSRDLERRISLQMGPDDEIHELAGNFNALFSRLQDRFQKEQQFTSDASHELRTPVAAIQAQAERGLDDDTDEAERRHALDRILFQAKSMSNTLNQLLLLTRADRQTVQLEMEDINLTELCELVVDAEEDEARSRDIRLMSRLDESVYVHGDQSLLMRIVMNLLSNGIKYNKPQGYVAVDLIRQNNEAVLTVSDSGIGIPPDEIGRIFNRFYRVNSSRSREKSTEYSSGLGLSIVRWAVDAHNGSIDVQSNEGSGSVFVVKLPLSKEKSL